MQAVEMLRAQELYIVGNGNHCILAGKAMGQESIEAEVTVWEVVGPSLPERTVESNRMLLTGSQARQSA